MMPRMFMMTFSLIVFIVCSKVEASKIIHLNPKESKTLTNSSLWTLNATCSMTSEKKSSGKIRIRVLKNKGSVNGKHLASGQSTLLNVSNDSQVTVSADSGTQIHLLNLGSDPVQASCSS